MADLDISASFVFSNIPDDSTFVHQAMDKLGFFCEFSDLALPDMQLALALALHMKRTNRQLEETWES